jgi:hypothetical protein
MLAVFRDRADAAIDVAVAADRLALLGERRLFVDVVRAECNSSKVAAITTPLAFCQGPLPMRSRALTPAAPPGSVVLR